jgi:hypothetical protein
MATKRYIMDEVAAELRVKKRWLAEFLRVRPCDEYGEPFYRLAGRVKLFTDSAVRPEHGAIEPGGSDARSESAGVSGREPAKAGLIASLGACTIWKLCPKSSPG